MRVIRFLSGFIAVVLLVFSCAPAFASSGTEYTQRTNFFHWFKDVPIVGNWIGYRSGLVCPISEDGYHHASSYYAVEDDGYYDCICTYCGKHFHAYESDLKQSYDKYVEELPATVYNSDGSLMWSPTHSYFSSSLSIGGTVYSYCDHFSNPSSHVETGVIVEEGNNFFISPVSENTSLHISKLEFFYSGIAPVSGLYERVSSLSLVVNFVFASSSVSSSSGDWSKQSYSYVSGDSVSDSFSRSVSWSTSKPHVSIYGTFYAPIYKVTPIDTLWGSTTYPVTSRPTTITGGNYGIVGDNGTINTVTNNSQIVNETNNTYYNPATGQTSTITDWSYNYEDRSYTLTLGSGDTTTVTYGDENITITENNVVEGDTIVNNYTIYYMIDGSGGGESHVHEWYQTGEQQGNCVTPAQRTYTCAVCGEQYTETDPVLGHSWRIIQTISTKYDENGSLLQEGYTIYECERCGEQYRATNDTGPPPSGADSTGPPDGSVSDGGLIEWLNGLNKSLSDNLSGIVDLLLRFFTEIPKLFGGFLDFLSAMFPFLPDEIMLLLTFGIAALVFVGVIKAIRR